MWCSEGVGRIQASTKALLEINLVYSHLPYTAEQQMVHKCLPHGDKRHGRNVAPKKPGAQEHTLHQTMKGKGRRDTSAVRHPGTGGLGGLVTTCFLFRGMVIWMCSNWAKFTYDVGTLSRVYFNKKFRDFKTE